MLEDPLFWVLVLPGLLLGLPCGLAGRARVPDTVAEQITERIAYTVPYKLSEVDQLGRRGGRGARVIVLLREHRFEAASRRVPRNRSAMDAAADNQQIERFHGHRVTVLKSSIADLSAGKVK